MASVAVGAAATIGGVVMVGMNSSTVMIVTMSVADPAMLGPSANPVERLGRFSVVSASTMRGNVRVVPGGPGAVERDHAGAGRHRDPLGADDAAGHHQVPDELVRPRPQILVRVRQLRRRVVDRQRIPEGGQSPRP